MSRKKIEGSIEAWEAGELGQDKEQTEVFSLDQSELDDALELQMISIRLQKGLIEELKLIAGVHGLGYQPLVRTILRRFVDGEMKMLAREYIANKMKNSEPIVEVEEENRNCA